MKVTFENGVATYSGKYDEVVYQSWYRNRLCIARKYAYPTLGAVHEQMKAIASNLNNLYLQADALYISDLKAYARKNAIEHFPKAKALRSVMPNAKSIFIKCMWEWQQSDPEHVELSSVNMEDIVQLQSPLKTVKACIDAGYLKRVSGYDSYIHPITTGP